jgi:anti-sigma regulatory factor (Ser/Thr protein kinase)
VADRVQAERVEGRFTDRSGPVCADPPGAPAPVVAIRQRRACAWRFPSTGQSVRGVRCALRPFLTRAGVAAAELDDLVLAACEAASNAVEHAQRSTEAYFDVTAETDGIAVAIAVRDYGRWQPCRGGRGDRGRGLSMMMKLAAVTLTSGPHGTSVTLRSLPA